MNEDRKPLRPTELRVLSELMKNSRRTDREVAKLLGISQPTVSRIRHRLERDGYVHEYTIIPDLQKLGYEILAITFVRLKQLSKEQTEKARKIALEIIEKGPSEIIMAVRGTGLGYAGVVVSFHENYSGYTEFLKWLRRSEGFEISETDSYIVSLADPVRYRPLTFRTLAQHILTLTSEKKGSK